MCDLDWTLEILIIEYYEDNSPTHVIPPTTHVVLPLRLLGEIYSSLLKPG